MRFLKSVSQYDVINTADSIARTPHREPLNTTTTNAKMATDDATILTYKLILFLNEQYNGTINSSDCIAANPAGFSKLPVILKHIWLDCKIPKYCNRPCVDNNRQMAISP